VPDIIYHCAGKATTKITCPEDELEMINTNIVATHNLLSAAENVDVVLTSSILVCDKYLNDKEQLEKNSYLADSKSMYGSTKAAQENIVRNSINVKNSHIVRLCAVVGAGTSHGMLRDFVRKAQDNSPEFEIFGKTSTYESTYNGLVTSLKCCCKPYIHVDEVVDYLMYQTPFKPQTYSGSSKTKNTWLSNNDIEADKVAKIVMDEIGVKKEITTNGQDFWIGDTPKIYSSRSPEIKYDVETTIRIAVQDILREQEKEKGKN
jgi:nucleoside-diphosphate-sugar epimerase